MGQHHHRPDQQCRRRRQQDPGDQVPDLVDVTDQPGRRVGVATARDPGRTEPDQGVPQPDPQPAGQPERRVVGDEPLQVAQQRLGQREGAHRHRRDGEGEHRWLPGGGGDQPGRGAGERHPRGQGERPEDDAEGRPPVHQVAKPAGGGTSHRLPAPSWRGRRLAGRGRGRRLGGGGAVRRQHHDRPPIGRVLHGGHHPRGGDAVQVRGRFVEQQHAGPVPHPQQCPGDRDPLALADRQGADRPAEQPGGADGGRYLPQLGVGGRRPGPVAQRQPQLLADRLRGEPGVLGDPGQRRPPPVRLPPRDVPTVGEDLALVRPDETHQDREGGALPAAAGTDSPVAGAVRRQDPSGGEPLVGVVRRHRAPDPDHPPPVRARSWWRVEPEDLTGGDGEGQAVRREPVPAGDPQPGHPQFRHPRWRRLGGTVRYRRGRTADEHLVHPPHGLHPVLAGVVGGSRRPQRPVALGHEQEHDQRRDQLHRPGDQPEADVDRDQRHRQAGQQLQGQRRQERHPQRAHARLPMALVDPSHRLGLLTGPPERGEHPEGPDEFEQVPGQPGGGVGRPAGAVLGVAPDERREQRDQRHGHQHQRGRRRVGEQDPPADERRHRRRRHQCGQVGAEVRVESVQPGRRQTAEPAHPARDGVVPTAPVDPLRATAEGRVEQRGPQLPFDPSGRAGRGRLQRPRDHRPAQDRRRRPPQGREDVPGGYPVHHDPGERGGKTDRLRDEQHGVGDREQADDDQRSAGRGRQGRQRSERASEPSSGDSHPCTLRAGPVGVQSHPVRHLLRVRHADVPPSHRPAPHRRPPRTGSWSLTGPAPVGCSPC